jgi:hypothetical protein
MRLWADAPYANRHPYGLSVRNEPVMPLDPKIAQEATDRIVADIDHLAHLMLTGYAPMPPCAYEDPASTVSG